MRDSAPSQLRLRAAACALLLLACAACSQTRAERAGAALDAVEQHLEEFGTITMSSPLLATANADFAFGLTRTADMYFASAKSEVQGTVATLDTVQQKLSLTASAAYTPTQIATYQAQLNDYYTQRALYEKQPVTPTSLPPYPEAPSPTPQPLALTATLPTATAAAFALLSLLPASTAVTSDRLALVEAAGNKSVQAIFNLLGSPEKAGQFDDLKVLFGVTMVGVNPGWRTKRRYAADLSINVKYDWQPARRSVVQAVIDDPNIPDWIRIQLTNDYGMPRTATETPKPVAAIKDLPEPITANAVGGAFVVVDGSGSKNAKSYAWTVNGVAQPGATAAKATLFVPTGTAAIGLIVKDEHGTASAQVTAVRNVVGKIRTLTEANVEILGGDGQNALAWKRAPQPLRIFVHDEFYNPVPDEPVSWTPNATDAHVHPESEKTNGLGIATALVDVGQSKVVVIPKLGTHLVPPGNLKFTINVVRNSSEVESGNIPKPTPPALDGLKIEIAGAIPSENGVNSEIAFKLVVKNQESGAPGKSIPVTFALPVGASAKTVGLWWFTIPWWFPVQSDWPVAVTDSTGKIDCRVKLARTAGPQTFTFRVNGKPDGSASFTINATADLDAGRYSVSFVSGDKQSGPSSQELSAPIVVQVIDAFENPVPRRDVSFMASDDAFVSLTGGAYREGAYFESSDVATTDEKGQASVHIKLGSEGTQRLFTWVRGQWETRVIATLKATNGASSGTSPSSGAQVNIQSVGGGATVGSGGGVATGPDGGSAASGPPAQGGGAASFAPDPRVERLVNRKLLASWRKKLDDPDTQLTDEQMLGALDTEAGSSGFSGIDHAFISDGSVAKAIADAIPSWLQPLDPTSHNQVYPTVQAVAPMMQTQVLDLASSQRTSSDLALQLAFVLRMVGLGADASVFEEYSHQHEKDARSRTSAVPANIYSCVGGLVGIEVGPQFRAIEDPGDEKDGPADVLERQSFPMLLILGLDLADTQPRIRLVTDPETKLPLRLEVEEPSIALYQNQRWMPLAPPSWPWREIFTGYRLHEDDLLAELNDMNNATNEWKSAISAAQAAYERALSADRDLARIDAATRREIAAFRKRAHEKYADDASALTQQARTMSDKITGHQSIAGDLEDARKKIVGQLLQVGALERAIDPLGHDAPGGASASVAEAKSALEATTNGYGVYKSRRDAINLLAFGAFSTSSIPIQYLGYKPASKPPDPPKKDAPAVLGIAPNVVDLAYDANGAVPQLVDSVVLGTSLSRVKVGSPPAVQVLTGNASVVAVRADAKSPDSILHVQLIVNGRGAIVLSLPLDKPADGEPVAIVTPPITARAEPIVLARSELVDGKRYEDRIEMPADVGWDKIASLAPLLDHLGPRRPTALAWGGGSPPDWWLELWRLDEAERFLRQIFGGPRPPERSRGK